MWGRMRERKGREDREQGKKLVEERERQENKRAKMGQNERERVDKEIQWEKKRKKIE